MSKHCPNLSNTKKSASTYVKWLASLECFDRILLCGSRSPLRDKQPHKNSDWDFALVSKIDKLKIVHPRTSGQLHADITIITEDRINDLPAKWVEVWPNDEHKVLT